MAGTDQTGTQVDLPVGLTGLNSSGVPTNTVNADSHGNMNVIDYATSATGSAVPADASYIGGKNPSGNLQGFLTDSSGRQYVDLFDASGNALNSTSNALNVFLTNSTIAVTQSTSPWITQDSNDGPVTPGTVATKSGLIGGQYNSTLPTLTAGQQAAIQVDSSGRLLVSGSSNAIDEATFTYGSSIFTDIGGVYQDTSPTLTAGQSGSVRLTQNRAFHNNLRNSAGSEITSTQTINFTKLGLDTTVVDGPQVDSYQRQRTADQQVLFSTYFSNTNHPLKWNTALTGSATAAFNATLGSNRLTTTTSSSDSVILQTKKYAIYTPGISYTVSVSGVMGPKTTNLRKRFGYFDTNDGFFFEITGTDYAVTLRTSISGSPIDTRYAQSTWNLDKLDGTGPSGVTLDTTKQNLYISDFVWQGTGRIRFGIMNGSTPLYYHQILNSNINLGPWMRSPSRPARVEMTNTGTTAGTNEMDIVCVDLIQESAGSQFVPYTFGASRGSTGLSVTTIKPLISIQPNTTFNTLTNRITIFPIKTDILSQQQGALIQVYLNATLTGASFAAPNSFSAAVIDTSATALSGGVVLLETYIAMGLFNTIDLSLLADAITLGLGITGSNPDTITIACTSLAGSTSIWAGITWQEFQ